MGVSGNHNNDTRVGLRNIVPTFLHCSRKKNLKRNVKIVSGGHVCGEIGCQKKKTKLEPNLKMVTSVRGCEDGEWWACIWGNKLLKKTN